MYGNLGIAMGAGMKEFSNQREAAERKEQWQKTYDLQRSAADRQNEQFDLYKQDRQLRLDDEARLKEANQYAADTMNNAGSFVNAMQGIGGVNGLESQLGHLTPEERQNAMGAYGLALRNNRGDNVAQQAASKVAAIDIGKGLQLQNQLAAQARQQLMQDAGKYIAAGNYAGLANFMSDNGVYNDGNGYKFLGQGKDGKLRFAQVGADGSASELPPFGDRSELMAFMQANMDPTKAIDYFKIKSAAEAERAQTEAYLQAARIRAAGGGGSGGGFNLTDEQAGVLNQALQYEELAKQYAKTNPAAAQQYRMAAVQTMESLPAKVQLAVRGKLGASPQEVDPWETPVEVTRMTPDGEIKMKVPMKVADRKGYSEYMRAQLYSGANLGAAFGEQRPAATPTARGLFTDAKGGTQLIEPLYRLNDWRKQLQQQSQE